MEVPKLWVKVNPPLDECITVNFISQKLRVQLRKKKAGIEHASGARETFFKFTSFRMLETPFWQVGQALHSSLTSSRQKLERCAWTLKEISLFYTTTNWNARKSVTSTQPDTTSIKGPRTLFQ